MCSFPAPYLSRCRISPNTRGKYRSIDALTLHLGLLVGIPSAHAKLIELPDANNIGQARKCSSVGARLSQTEPGLQGGTASLDGLKLRCQPRVTLCVTDLCYFESLYDETPSGVATGPSVYYFNVFVLLLLRIRVRVASLAF